MVIGCGRYVWCWWAVMLGVGRRALAGWWSWLTFTDFAPTISKITGAVAEAAAVGQSEDVVSTAGLIRSA